MRYLSHTHSSSHILEDQWEPEDGDYKEKKFFDTVRQLHTGTHSSYDVIPRTCADSNQTKS